jgi:uncharacterized protein (TIGR00297 family)
VRGLGRSGLIEDDPTVLERDHQTDEVLRKSIHIAIGVFAFALAWVTWWQAAAVCALAVAGNLWLLHRLFGRRVARHERGYDFGIVIYPLAVMLLVILFRERLEIAGAVWGVLAFGDGFATLAGRAVRGPRLPWNRDKSWSGLVAFVAFGFVGAEVVWTWLHGSASLFLIGAMVAVCAVVESLPLHVDDNLTVPLAGAATMALLTAMHDVPQPRFNVVWLVANALLAILGYLLKGVDLSGLVAGALLGSVVILFGGWQLYAVLLAFFVIGTALTRLGYARKARLGLAQEKGGRRGASHAFANSGVAAILAVAAAGAHDGALWFAAAAALATAAADTAASEIGQLFGRRTFLPLTFQPVERGTEGAVSFEGTVAGVVSAALVSLVAVLAARAELRMLLLLTLAASAGSYIESVAGSWNRKQPRPVPNGALNFFNTAVGAALLLLLMQVA